MCGPISSIRVVKILEMQDEANPQQEQGRDGLDVPNNFHHCHFGCLLDLYGFRVPSVKRCVTIEMGSVYYGVVYRGLDEFIPRARRIGNSDQNNVLSIDNSSNHLAHPRDIQFTKSSPLDLRQFILGLNNKSFKMGVES